MNGHSRWIWIPQLIVVGILGPMGWGKLAGTVGEIELFTMLGMEPTGRILVGLVELGAAALLLTPYAANGAVLAISVMLGALIAHSTHLGFDPTAEGGIFVILLFVVLISAHVVVYFRRKELPFIGETL
jgi:hypothetical protein